MTEFDKALPKCDAKHVVAHDLPPILSSGEWSFELRAAEFWFGNGKTHRYELPPSAHFRMTADACAFVALTLREPLWRTTSRGPLGARKNK